MSDLKAQWHFPVNDGGMEYGYNNASTEHFKEDPIGKLVRETIQNSLDAKQSEEPVHVEIRAGTIDPDQIGGGALRQHLVKAREHTRHRGQMEGVKAYKRALKLLDRRTLPTLAIIDRNTTGLVEENWRSLLYEEGVPAKGREGVSGGSFGIGKNAPFNATDLSTVIYGTRFTGPEGRVERMMGRAQLVSHHCPHDPEKTLQHIGFFGHGPREPLEGPDIPSSFRLAHPGTGLWIIGFTQDPDKWPTAAIRATVDSFFCAIHQRKLVVHIQAETGRDESVIAHDTIEKYLSRWTSSDKTWHYHRAILEEPIGFAQASEPGMLGRFSVHLNQEEGAPRRVAYVNRRGMLITDTKERNRSNPFHPGRGHGGWPDFAAVVMAMDDETDREIRRMENPAHDLIAVDRLPENQQPGMRKAMRAVSDEIKILIEQAIREKDLDGLSNLQELADMFPDLDPNQEGNRALNTRVVEPKAPNPDIKQDPTGGDEDEVVTQREDETGDEEPMLPDGNGKGGNSTNGNSGSDITTTHPERVSVPSRSIGRMQILRTGPQQLALALHPGVNPDATVYFTVQPSGEERLPEKSTDIESINQIHSKDVKAELVDDGTIAVTFLSEKRETVLLTVNLSPDTPYIGYGFRERPAPQTDKPASSAGNPDDQAQTGRDE